MFEKAGDHYNAGISFLRVDDDKRALANFQKVKSTSPDYESAITQMANLFLKNRKPQLVIEKIGRLLQDKPLSKSNLEWYYALGQAYENSGDFKKAFETCDVILTPVAPTPAFKIGEKVEDPLTMYLSDVFTISANLAGIPGMSVPCGFSAERLPIGLQLLGRHFEEEKLMKVAYNFEQATEFHKKKPEI